MTHPTPIRLLLADDHSIVRQGLRALIETQSDLTVVAEAGNGREAVQRAIEETPDVVVMDLAMPHLNGVEATRQIRAELPNTKVLVLSMHAGEEYVRPAVRAGASGYLLKGAGLQDLTSAIRRVHQGETTVDPRLESIVSSTRRNDESSEPHQPLTPRQREILQLVAEGYSSNNIASLLDLSVKTVETHRSNIMDRLQIFDLAGLVKYAVRTGMVSPAQ
ncbi:MAG: response regulator transcription factor [Myxococcales bacterium]|nr:response regulator transcription factor [Myxococcales bacterium]